MLDGTRGWIVRQTLVIGMLLACTAGFAQAGIGGADYQKIAAEKGPALVTIKYVLKLKMGGMMGDQESESEISGWMIDPKGLVLCSNTQLTGFTSMLRQMMGPMGGNMSATPTDLKVLVGEDTEGLEAKLLAHDTELDLAWVQIKEPPSEHFAFIDMGKSAKPAIGDRLLSVRRMGKHFDRVTTVGEGRIGGFAAKPRDLYIPAGGLVSGLGQGVFTSDGKFVGVSVLQMPDSDEGAFNPMSMMTNMLSMQDTMAGLVLPAAAVIKATERARKSADSDEAAD